MKDESGIVNCESGIVNCEKNVGTNFKLAQNTINEKHEYKIVNLKS